MNQLVKELALETGGKIVMLILDGLGGLPRQAGGLTALEYAQTPALDALAHSGTVGLSHPIGRGITPGSGPAHLALFGYDPVAIPVGRGVLSALGVGADLRGGTVAARGNFCTLDEDGMISDRRAGRIADSLAKPLVEKLNQIKVDGVEIEVRHEKEYRFVLILRGEGLNGSLGDTDPQMVGVAPLAVEALVAEAEKTAGYVQQWLDQAREILAEQPAANMVTLRGFAQDPGLPTFAEMYKLKAACVAVYPMYKGVARLVGMDILETGKEFTPADQFQVVADNWDKYDFFFVHIKPTDSRGEDGDFEGKAAVIESVDQVLADLLALNPDVLLVTGDHSTPAKLRSHSWHPVPLLLWAPNTHLQDRAQLFGEREAQERGGLGHLPAKEIMSLAMAHALRLGKYGA